MSTVLPSTIFVWYFLLHVSTHRVMRDIAEAAARQSTEGKEKIELNIGVKKVDK